MPAYYNETDPYAAQWLRNLITAGRGLPWPEAGRSGGSGQLIRNAYTFNRAPAGKAVNRSKAL